MKPVFLAAAAALLLGACASEGPPEEIRELPSYQAGYADGCRSGQTNTGKFSGKVYRNKELADQDSAYRAGWRNGYNACGGRTPSNEDPIIGGSRVGPEPL